MNCRELLSTVTVGAAIPEKTNAPTDRCPSEKLALSEEYKFPLCIIIHVDCGAAGHGTEWPTRSNLDNETGL